MYSRNFWEYTNPGFLYTIIKKWLGSSLSRKKSWRQKNSLKSDWLLWGLETRKDCQITENQNPWLMYYNQRILPVWQQLGQQHFQVLEVMWKYGELLRRKFHILCLWLLWIIQWIKYIRAGKGTLNISLKWEKLWQDFTQKLTVISEPENRSWKAQDIVLKSIYTKDVSMITTPVSRSRGVSY